MSRRDLSLRATPELPRELSIAVMDDGLVTVASTMAAGLGGEWNTGWATGTKPCIVFGKKSTTVLTLWLGDACFDLLLREAVRVATFLHIDLPVLPMAAGVLPSPRPLAAVGTLLDVHA